MANPFEGRNNEKKKPEETNFSQEKIAVKITDITDFRDWKEFWESTGKKEANLGDREVEKRLKELLDFSMPRSESEKIYFLQWGGGRVPLGAIVAGKEIGWTQHGLVKDVNGTLIGTYERVTDTNTQQEMLIFMSEGEDLEDL